ASTASSPARRPRGPGCGCCGRRSRGAWSGDSRGWMLVIGWRSSWSTPTSSAASSTFHADRARLVWLVEHPLARVGIIEAAAAGAVEGEGAEAVDDHGHHGAGPEQAAQAKAADGQHRHQIDGVVVGKAV